MANSSKRSSLAGLAVNSGSKPAPAPAPARAAGETRALYCKITSEAHRQLSILKLDTGQDMAELVADALNLKFREIGLPEVA